MSTLRIVLTADVAQDEVQMTADAVWEALRDGGLDTVVRMEVKS